ASQITWRGQPPLLFITTATASTAYNPDGPAAELMQLYPGRSFRFCFTNKHIAQAIVDFVWSMPDLRPHGDPGPAASCATFPALTGVHGAVTQLGAFSESYPFPPSVSALEWDDDPYSVDLSRQFHDAFHQPKLGPVLVRETHGIPFSVGGTYTPN